MIQGLCSALARKKLKKVPVGLFREGFGGNFQNFSGFFNDMNNFSGVIPLAAEGYRGQVGGIGFKEQAVQWNYFQKVPDYSSEGCPGPFGDASACPWCPGQLPLCG